MKATWIVDTTILDNNILYSKILDAIENSDVADLYKSRYIPFQEDQDYGPDEFKHRPCVLYGCVNYIEKCNVVRYPGAYGYSKDGTKWSRYTNFLDHDYLLNSDFVMTYWGDLKNNPQKYMNMFNSKYVFVRPDSGLKTFTGFVADLTDDVYMMGQDKTTSVNDWTIVVVSSKKRIDGEFRFIVCNGEVIAGSEYRWDNILDIRSDYDKSCFELAQKVAKKNMFDSVYTCDVALTDTGPKVVELNSFSCAGWYACDYEKVVDTISKAAISEFFDMK